MLNHWFCSLDFMNFFVDVFILQERHKLELNYDVLLWKSCHSTGSLQLEYLYSFFFVIFFILNILYLAFFSHLLSVMIIYMHQRVSVYVFFFLFFKHSQRNLYLFRRTLVSFLQTSMEKELVKHNLVLTIYLLHCSERLLRSWQNFL